VLYRHQEIHSRPYYQDFFRCFNAGAREGVLGQAEYDTSTGMKSDHPDPMSLISKKAKNNYTMLC